MQRTKGNQNIQVYIRVRPKNSREKCIRSLDVVEVASSKEILVRQALDSKTRKFVFDKTFGPDSLQCDVYSVVVAPMIQEVLAGYSCTVFAYGQTSTGKTYTMVGDEPESKYHCEDDNSSGIIPRAFNHLFDELRLLELEFSMRVSYLELYNEDLCDLLSTDDTTKFKIYDDSAKKGSVIIQGLEEIPVHTKSDLYMLLAKGQNRRKTASTLMNAQSSRSHTLFSIIVHIKENRMDGEEILKIGKLNLVDLAGSENICKAGCEKGIRVRETVNINQSLLTLGRVITALVERTPHVPYRESKLTRILQESLGGRTKTSIIATISPGHKDLEETLSTLDYAHRAKNIQNKPEVNQRLNRKTIFKEYTEEIDRLKRELFATRDKNGIYLPEETFNDLQYKLDSQNKELNEKLQFIKAMKDELANKQRIFSEVNLNLIDKTEKLQKTSKDLKKKEHELNHTKKVLKITSEKYKEKKFMLKKHVETEEILTDQAKELIYVAKTASTDSLNLQNAIERRKITEVEVRKHCDDFHNKINILLENIQTKFDHLQKLQSDRTNSMLLEINKNTEENKCFASQFVDKLSMFSLHNSNSIENLIQFVDSYSFNSTTNMEFFLIDIKSKLSQIQENQQLYKNNLNEKLAKILTDFNNQKGKNNEFNNNIKKYSTENKISILNFISSNTNFLTENLNQIVFDHNENINNLKENLNTNTQSINEVEQNLDEFFQTYQKLKLNLNTLKCTNSNIEKIVGKVDSEKDEMKIRFDNQITERNEFKENLESNCFYENKFVEFDKNIMNDFNLNTENIENGKLIISQNFKNVDDILNDISVLSENHLKTINKSKQQNCSNNIQLKLNKLTSSVRQNIQESIETIKAENSRMDISQKQMNFLNQTLQKSMEASHLSFNKLINDSKEKVNFFKTKEMPTYTPTGETPTKKEYSIRKDLVVTSPHERLKQKFKLEHTNMILDIPHSISEPYYTDTENSFISDLSNMAIIMSSTQASMESGVVTLDSSNSETDEILPIRKTSNKSTKM